MRHKGTQLQSHGPESGPTPIGLRILDVLCPSKGGLWEMLPRPQHQFLQTHMQEHLQLLQLDLSAQRSQLEVTQGQGGAQVASLWPWLHLLQLFLLLRAQGPRHKQSPGLSHT